MNRKTNRTLPPLSLGLLALAACISTTWAAATKTPFSGTETHVAWLSQGPPEMTPSGNLKIRGWENLWYDDMDDDRLDGYVTVAIWANFHKSGELVAGGTFTVREKLDDLTLEDFSSESLDLAKISQGAILWEGTWTLGKDGVVSAVARSPEGLIAFYTYSPSGDPNVSLSTGYILNPHGE